MTVPVPGATLGVVGGGQLGRMLAEAASPLGVDVLALDPTSDCPAVPPARRQVTADFDDEDGLRDLAARADALTFEIELADPDILERVARDAGVPVHPSPDTLRTIQDKLVQNRALADAGIPVAPFCAVDDDDDLEAAFDDLGSPLMLKARTGGYDGHGNAPVESVADARETFDGLDGLVAEELVEFERELSVIGARGDGETATYPVAENVHEAEILRESVVPARTSDAVREETDAVARDVLDTLDGRGVFGIELFECASPRDAGHASGGNRERAPRSGAERSSVRGSRDEDDRILVNEIAPRPHNSGHYTIEGCHTSQFEQHVRGVLGLPLGDTALRAPAAMANLLGDDRPSRPAELDGVSDALAESGVAVHWYGKREVRPLRKMGHVTAVADDGIAVADDGSAVADDKTTVAGDHDGRDALLDRARNARDELQFR